MKKTKTPDTQPELPRATFTENPPPVQFLPAPAPAVPAAATLPDVPIPDIAAAVRATRESSSKTYPVRSLHASKIGHPCTRHLVYRRTRWDAIPKADAKLQGIFRRGRVVGEDVAVEVREALKAAGISVQEQESPIPTNPWDIGGKVDFKVLIPGPGPHDRPTAIPVEVKSMAPFGFDQIPETNPEAVAWFFGHRQAYIRTYPGQLLTYMHFMKSPFGIMLVRNAQTFEDRQIVFAPDPAIMGEYLAKADTVKAAVGEIEKADAEFFHARALDDSGTLPERVPWAGLDAYLPKRIDWDPDICGKCDFAAYCVPDITSAPGIHDRMNDDDLNSDCTTYWETQDNRKAYEDANDRINAHLKSIVAAEKPGAVLTFITRDFGIVVRKTEKTVRKEIQPISTMNKPPVET